MIFLLIQFTCLFLIIQFQRIIFLLERKQFLYAKKIKKQTNKNANTFSIFSLAASNSNNSSCLVAKADSYCTNYIKKQVNDSHSFVFTVGVNSLFFSLTLLICSFNPLIKVPFSSESFSKSSTNSSSSLHLVRDCSRSFVRLGILSVVRSL